MCVLTGSNLNVRVFPTAALLHRQVPPTADPRHEDIRWDDLSVTIRESPEEDEYLDRVLLGCNIQISSAINVSCYRIAKLAQLFLIMHNSSSTLEC